MNIKRLLLLLSVFFWASALYAKEPAKTISGKIIKVSDGDTVTLLDAQNFKTKIRLYGIDAPEKKQAFGVKSKEFLSNIALGKRVTAYVYDIDRYGRNVALIYIGDLNINKKMVTAGYAWVYVKYNKLADAHEWIKLETTAKIQKLGLWNSETAVAPWHYRLAHRKTQVQAANVNHKISYQNIVAPKVQPSF